MLSFMKALRPHVYCVNPESIGPEVLDRVVMVLGYLTLTVALHQETIAKFVLITVL